jgi:hypothetical protein
VGIVWKPDLEDLRFFLGHDYVCLSYVQDGRPVAQLPFLALEILQPVESHKGGTHFDVLPESSTEHKIPKKRLRQDS